MPTREHYLSDHCRRRLRPSTRDATEAFRRDRPFQTIDTILSGVPIALTPTSYLVLGCLATGGPATPYELKQQVLGGVGYFWTFPHSQLYSEPARLAAAGYVSEEREEGGRRRRVFSVTDAGRAALRSWLADPTDQLPEIRDIALLKLFFGAQADAAQLVSLAKAQRDAHRRRLETYEAMDAAAGPDRSTVAAGATLGLGLAFERAASAFWSAIADNPPTA
jgi:DNA-binding PadR family transcriptional regulator